MYNKYKIGREDKGLLILLAVEDRDIRIEVGAGLEEYINDAKAGRLMDIYAIPDLKNNNYSDALVKLQNGIIKELNALLNGKESTVPEVSEENSTSEAELWVYILVIIIFVIVVVLGAIFDDGSGYGGGYYHSSSSGRSSGSSGFGGHSSGGGASRHF